MRYIKTLKALSMLLTLVIANQPKFKTCLDSSFCRRYRSWKDLNERPVLAVQSVGKINDDSASGDIDFQILLKSSAELVPNYSASISISRESGYLRLTIDDISNESGRKRYRVPDEDLRSPDRRAPGDVRARVHAQYLHGSTVLAVPGLYRVEVLHSDFRIKVYNSLDQLVQIVNAKNFFSFEKYRSNVGDSCLDGTSVDMSCHSDVDTSDLWEEEFDGFTDTKRFGPSAVGLDVELVSTEAVFGLPEHTLPFKLPVFQEQTGTPHADEGWEEIRFFNADVFMHPLNSHSALYGSIPMLTAIHSGGSSTASASGVLWLNPSETFVALSRRVDARLNVESTWVSETGVIDLVILPGPTPAHVLEQFHSFTGKPAFPPVFALGFHQSKWGYRDEIEVDQVSADFVENEIPIDVVWLDIQHTNGNRYMTWSSEFSQPEWLTSQVASRGQKLVTIMDPHIKVDTDYTIYREAKNRKFFIQKGHSDFVGQCWPGDSSYLDAMRSDVREYWSSLLDYKSYRGSSPNMFSWNDMNEPSVFNSPEMTLPRSTLHQAGTVEHREVHNIYGEMFHRATFEGQLNRNGPHDRRRPFVLSRSFFVGSHRYGPVWTGDNQASWEFLQVSVPMLLSLAISGQSFAGADVGGYDGNPDKELYIRWHQLGAMVYPFYRCHSSLDSMRREPWMFDEETLSIVRSTIQQRYALLPYWYTTFSKYALDGTPIIKPLWFNFLQDRKTIGIEDEILVGDSILVRPVLEASASSVDVYLPDTEEVWFDFHEPSNPPLQGGQKYSVPVTLEYIPAFIKGGSIIPLKLTKRQSTEDMKNDPVSLRVFLVDDRASGFLYIDDEYSMGYLDKQDFGLIQINFIAGVLTCHQVRGARAVDVIKIDRFEIYGLGERKPFTVQGICQLGDKHEVIISERTNI